MAALSKVQCIRSVAQVQPSFRELLPLGWMNHLRACANPTSWIESCWYWLEFFCFLHKVVKLSQFLLVAFALFLQRIFGVALLQFQIQAEMEMLNHLVQFIRSPGLIKLLKPFLSGLPLKGKAVMDLLFHLFLRAGCNWTWQWLDGPGDTGCIMLFSSVSGDERDMSQLLFQALIAMRVPLAIFQQQVLDKNRTIRLTRSFSTHPNLMNFMVPVDPVGTSFTLQDDTGCPSKLGEKNYLNMWQGLPFGQGREREQCRVTLIVFFKAGHQVLPLMNRSLLINAHISWSSKGLF